MTDREKLIRNLERRATGADLEKGIRRCHVELDGRLLGSLLKGLVKSGVPQVGARLLRSLPDLKAKQPEFYGLIEKLDALLPGGESKETSTRLLRRRGLTLMRSIKLLMLLR